MKANTTAAQPTDLQMLEQLLSTDRGHSLLWQAARNLASRNPTDPKLQGLSAVLAIADQWSGTAARRLN